MCFSQQARVTGRKKRGQGKSKDGKDDEEKADDDKADDEKADDDADAEKVSFLLYILPEPTAMFAQMFYV